MPGISIENRLSEIIMYTIALDAFIFAILGVGLLILLYYKVRQKPPPNWLNIGVRHLKRFLKINVQDRIKNVL